RSYVDAAAEASVVCVKAPQHATVHSAKRLDVRRPAGACAGDDVGPAVAIDVARSYVDAAAEAGVVCVKAPQHATVHSAKRLDVSHPAGACPGDDVAPAGAFADPRSYVDAAAEAGVVGVKASQQREIYAAQHLDVGRAAGSSGRDDVEDAVAIDVSQCDANAAEEAGAVGQEIEPDRASRVKDLHFGRAAGVPS